MDPELKPCPFCGGKAGYDQRRTAFHCVEYVWDVCCGGTCPENLFVRATGATKREAAAIWNRRRRVPEAPKR